MTRNASPAEDAGPTRCVRCNGTKAEHDRNGSSWFAGCLTFTRATPSSSPATAAPNRVDDAGTVKDYITAHCTAHPDCDCREAMAALDRLWADNYRAAGELTTDSEDAIIREQWSRLLDLTTGHPNRTGILGCVHVLRAMSHTRGRVVQQNADDRALTTERAARLSAEQETVRLRAAIERLIESDERRYGKNCVVHVNARDLRSIAARPAPTEEGSPGA